MCSQSLSYRNLLEWNLPPQLFEQPWEVVKATKVRIGKEMQEELTNEHVHRFSFHLFLNAAPSEMTA